MPDTFLDGSNRILVDIYDREQQKVGPGPLLTCLDFSCDSLLSQAGTFSARFPANDPRLAHVQLKRNLLLFYVDSHLIFAGIAEADRHEVADDGTRILLLTGRDMLAELDETSIPQSFYRSVNTHIPRADVPWSVVIAYNILNSYAGSSVTRKWHMGYEVSHGPTAEATETLVYGEFVGETALRALTRIAEHTGESFRLALTGPVQGMQWPPGAEVPQNPVRHIEWLNTRWEPSGVRAIQGVGDAIAAEENQHICFIQHLSVRRDASSMATRIYPYGSGFGETRLDLRGNGRWATMPVGYNYDESDNCLISVAGETYVGKEVSRHVSFKDIRPLFNTDADVLAAKNYLFDAALAYLQRNDHPDDTLEYDIEVIALPQHVKVGMLLRVVYQDADLDLDVDLMILGIRRTVGRDGGITYRLTVSHTNQWRLSENSPIVTRLEEGDILTGHPQIDANAYWENFKEEVGSNQTTESAEFPFWLSEEVVTIRQVLFRYRVDPLFLSGYRYAYASPTTGQNAAGNTGPTTATMQNATVTLQNTNVTVNQRTGLSTNETTVSTDSQSATVTSGALVEGHVTPISGGNNQNETTSLLSPEGTPITETGQPWLAGDFIENTFPTELGVTASPTVGTVIGDSTADPSIPSVVPPLTSRNVIDEGTETGPPLDWGLDGTFHYHEIISHTHNFAHFHAVTQEHQHRLWVVTGEGPVLDSSHSHGMPHVHIFSHKHEFGHNHNIEHTHTHAHTHGTPAHAHTIPNHAHSTVDHTHVANAHAHVMNEHAHSVPQHIHAAPALVETFSTSEASALVSYVMADLEFRVNGSEWMPLDGGDSLESLGIPIHGGYYQTDITSYVQQSGGLMRPIREYNLIEVRRKTSADAGKAAMIRAKVGIRSTIQSIVLYN